MIGRTNHTQFASADPQFSAATNESSQPTLPPITALEICGFKVVANPAIPEDKMVAVFGESIIDRVEHRNAQQFQTQCDELRAFIYAHGLDAVKEAIKLYKIQQGLK